MFDHEIPVSIQDWLGVIPRLTLPEQGCTSQLAVLEAERGVYVLKHTVEPLFKLWLAEEHRVLCRLTQTALPIPQPRAYVEDASGAWLLMDYLPGEPLTAALQRAPVGERTALMRSFGAVLATIHATPPPAGMPWHTSAQWLDAALETGAMHLRDYRDVYDAPALPALLARLRRQRPAPVPATLIHGDFTTDNVLIVGERVTGIIDWSGGAVGDPRYDVALALDVALDETALTPDEIAAFYAGYGGPRLSKAEQQYFVDLYELF